RMRIAVGCVLFTLVAGVVLRASLSPPRTLTSALVEPEAADAVSDSGQAPAALLAAPSLTEAARATSIASATTPRIAPGPISRADVVRIERASRRPPLAGFALGRTPAPPQSAPRLAPISSIIAVERAEPSLSAATTTQAEPAAEPSNRRAAA